MFRRAQHDKLNMTESCQPEPVEGLSKTASIIS